MSPVRPPSRAAAAVAALAAVTTLLTLQSWAVIADDAGAFLDPLLWVALLVAGSGLALRAFRVPRFLVPVGQVALVGLLLHRWYAGDDAPYGGWLPSSSGIDGTLDTLRRAVEAAGLHASPVPAEATAFPPIMVVSGAAVLLLVDLFACTLRRAPLAGLPLLAAFTAPVSLLGGVPWLTFALAAISFVLLLAAEQAARLAQWGRNISGPAPIRGGVEPREVRLATLWPAASRIGVVGVGLAVLAPLAVPSWDGWSSGIGPGDGDGDGNVTVENPMVDVRRDLASSADVPLVRMRTDDPAPAYLRISVLDEFDGAAWRPSEREIPTTNEADGPLPAPPGLAQSTPRTRYRYEFDVTEAFSSRWLPAPYPATEVRAPGDWRYDDETLDVLGVDGTDAAGISYETVALRVDPDPTALVNAAPGPQSLSSANTELPDSTPDWIETQADRLTAGGRSDFEKAVILQQWFREDGGFKYSLDPGSGTSLEQLELFLGAGPGSRRGYCEQFASAMTMMARALNIPARVAVGFLRPEESTDGVWTYSSRDMHAWPELYFEGTGWVRFEPTPQQARTVPAYTSGQVPAPEELAAPSASTSAPEPSATRAPREEVVGSTSDDAEGGLPGWLVPVGVVLLLAGLCFVPQVVRGAQRRRRYDETDPATVAESAWDELRATALDLGVAWDDTATLRRQAIALVPALGPSHGPTGGGPDETRHATRALESLALLVERARYSRHPLDDAAQEQVKADTRTVTGVLVDVAAPRRRRRARWLPASLWRGHRQVQRRRGDRQPPGAGPARVEGLDRVSV
jgi:transglutaminase-like putative cysteine protease